MKLAFACLALFVMGPWPSDRAHAAAPGTADARLGACFREYLEEWFRNEPLAATRLGDHRFDDRLDDLTPEARRANLERDRRWLELLPTKVDTAALSRDGQIDLEIFRKHLERAVWLGQTFHPFEDDPRVWGEYATEGVYLLLTQSSLPQAENIRNAIARVGQVPRIVSEARKTIRNPPVVKVETAIKQTRGAIGFYESGLLLLARASAGSDEEKRLREVAGRAAEALKGHLAFLEKEVRPRAGSDWRIGPERFARKLELELDSGLGAEEVMAEAQREAARVEAEMVVIARQLWASLYPGRAIPPDDQAGRRELTRMVLDRIGDERSTTDTVVDDVKASAEDVKAFIRQARILPLPEPDQCRIVVMPEFLRGNSTAYLNAAPPLDPKGSSEYAVSPPPAEWTATQVESYFREYNRAMLRILTIHEAYPGHYVQLEYSNRCPSAIRKILSSGTFSEGWAVYTEQMMLDQGYGSGDPRLRLQQLKFYLRAVVNAILDHEMHAGSMTDEQARELLMGRAFQTEGEALGKIIRAKQSSAQLSTYFVGRTAFYRLRQAIHREQGERFDLSRFHQAVLAHGTLPVKFLPELVRRTLSEGAGALAPANASSVSSRRAVPAGPAPASHDAGIPGPRSGALVVCGGGKLPPRVRETFLRLAGGPKARLVVIPTASESADTPEAAESLDPWRPLAPAKLELLHTRSKTRADSPDFIKALEQATGVWFGGGDQSRVTEAYLGTATEKALLALLDRGGVIGGTSAGAAIMSRVMITGGNQEASLGTGFGFLPGVVVDQHALRRNRLNRLVSVLDRHNDLTGVAIDEATALVVTRDRWDVVGDSYVMTVRLRGNGRPPRLEVYHQGGGGDVAVTPRAKAVP